MPHIETRFTNPRFDMESRKYFLDVEISSTQTKEFLFGMNLRFYYDASMMEFQYVDDFRAGYGLLGAKPKIHVGNENSGAQLFNFSQAAAYINGAIQLMDESLALELSPAKWVKVFRVCFKVPLLLPDEDQFCPSVIWDLKSNPAEGGFLPGGDGLLITVTENNRDTRKVSAPSRIVGLPFNWQYTTGYERPYGKKLSTHCISVAELVSTEDPDKIDANGYALFQNQPNPFDAQTMIEFVLPYAQRATLTFYDVDGSISEEIRGDFAAGKNQVILKQKSWMAQSSIIYYRLQTEKYTSRARKMTLVRT